MYSSISVCQHGLTITSPPYFGKKLQQLCPVYPHNLYNYNGLVYWPCTGCVGLLKYQQDSINQQYL